MDILCVRWLLLACFNLCWFFQLVLRLLVSTLQHAVSSCQIRLECHQNVQIKTPQILRLVDEQNMRTPGSLPQPKYIETQVCVACLVQRALVLVLLLILLVSTLQHAVYVVRLDRNVTRMFKFKLLKH